MRTITKYSTTLSSSITSSQTTIPVSSIQTVDDTKVTLTMVSFGTAAVAYMVIEPTGTNIEIIKFTGITSNGDGTGTLTGVTRGLAFSGATETAVTANGKAHQAGSKIILSNTHYWYDQLVDKSSSEVIAGVKTFSSIPATTGGSPVEDNDLARKRYVDVTATGTTVIAAIVVPGLAGETVADGQLVYYNVATSRWALCDADTATTVDNVQLGIAQGAGTSGNAIANGILISGIDDAQSGMTTGTKMYASNTAGGVSSTPGTVNVTVGIARSPTVLYFFPRYAQQVISTRISALAGSSGTPSASNKYVTAADVSAVGVADKIIRASATLIAPGIHVPVEQLQRDDNTQGDILYRSASRWTRLIAGTTDQLLRTKGSSANPVWATIATINVVATYASNAQQTATTDPATVFTRTILGNTLGRNGMLVGRMLISDEVATGAALRFSYGGTQFASISIDETTTEQEIFITMVNRNATNSQFGSISMFNNAGTVASEVAHGTAAIDSTADQTLTVSVAGTTPTIVIEYIFFYIIHA